MSFKMQTTKYTKNCLKQYRKQLIESIESADAVLIGAGAGMSAAAGFTYSGKRFTDYFTDFIEKYQINDMYSGGFYPYKTLEEYWAYWSRYIYINRYDQPAGKPYEDLLNLVKNKDYFVITTNVDHRFQAAGFDKKRLFYTQGDYGLWQCSKPCHKKTYDNEKAIRSMLKEQIDRKIPSDLIPYCPICKAPMSMNLRCDSTFVEDDGWHKAADRYENFLHKTKKLSILYLELGVGENTPGIIKYPFWNMTYHNKKALYICINSEEIMVPQEIRNQSVCMKGDIGKVLEGV